MEIIVQLNTLIIDYYTFRGPPEIRCTEEKTSTSKKTQDENNVKITRVKIIKSSIQVEFSQSLQIEFSLQGYIFSLLRVQIKCRRCKFVEISLLDSCYRKIHILELNFLIDGIKSSSCGFRDGWSIVVVGGGGVETWLVIALNKWCQTLRGTSFNRRWWRSSIPYYVDMWGWRRTSRGGQGEKLCQDVCTVECSIF